MHLSRVTLVALSFVAASQSLAQTNIFKSTGQSTPSTRKSPATKPKPVVPAHPLADPITQVNDRAFQLAKTMPVGEMNPVAAPFGFWQASIVGKAVDDRAAVPPKNLQPMADFVMNRAGEAQSSTGQLRHVMAVWPTGGQGKVGPGVAKRMTDAFKVTTRGLDLTNKAEAAREVDDWLVQATNGNVARSVTAVTLGGSPSVVVTDAVRFESEWQTPFDSAETKPAAFTATNGATVELPTMAITFNLPYVKTADVEMVLLPLAEPSISDEKTARYVFAVLLPPEGKDVASVAGALNSQKWTAWFDEAIITDAEMKAWEDTAPESTLESDNEAWMATYPLKAVAVSLPRFSARSPQAGVADWQSQAAGSAALFVQGIDLKISESGVEDVNAVAPGHTGGVVGEPVPFTANRPFLFAIVEKATGAIVLIGQFNGVK